VTIDWLTVGAQVVNFLVLVYLLRRFLYGPIVAAMTRREEAIAERLREARQQREAAEEEARRHREAREALQAEREQMLARAREEADDLRQAQEKELRREIDETRARWRAELEHEQAAFLRDVRLHVAEQFGALARRALADLASAELEVEIVRVLSARLGTLDEAHREAFARAAASGLSLRVRSAFELPAAARTTLSTALRHALGDAVEVAYEQAGDVVCGVEIRGGGQSLAWSLQDYLDALERRVAAGLGELAAGRTGEARR
jgi:F-type H+-transporting ATPase subunit b